MDTRTSSPTLPSRHLWVLMQFKNTYDDHGGSESIWVPDLDHIYEDELTALRAANDLNADPDTPMFCCAREFEIKIGVETVKRAVEGMLDG